MLVHFVLIVFYEMLLNFEENRKGKIKMKKHDIKAFIFDMDGVIFDSEIKVIECWSEIAEKYKIPHIEDFCIECMGQNREAAKKRFLEIYGQDMDYDGYKLEMSNLFHSRYGEGRLPLKPGVVETLSYLKDKGYLLAIASSTRREVVTAELRDAGLISYFDKIICGDMVEHSKPNPEIYLKACKELGVLPEEAYGIEDSHNGIRAVHRAGMFPIMVPDQMPVTEEMKKLSYRIYSMLKELVVEEIC